jgi:hypothetical protein
MPVLAVHDEIVVVCPANDADAIKGWLGAAMVDAMAPTRRPDPGRGRSEGRADLGRRPRAIPVGLGPRNRLPTTAAAGLANAGGVRSVSVSVAKPLLSGIRTKSHTFCDAFQDRISICHSRC